MRRQTQTVHTFRSFIYSFPTQQDCVLPVDESDAKIFSVPDSETDQQSSPHIQLKLMRRQPQQGNADGVLVANN